MCSERHYLVKNTWTFLEKMLIQAPFGLLTYSVWNVIFVFAPERKEKKNRSDLNGELCDHNTRFHAKIVIRVINLDLWADQESQTTASAPAQTHQLSAFCWSCDR